MKRSRKILMVLVSLTLMAFLIITASASVSKRFFVEKSNYHTCTGSGTISDNIATATFSATALPNSPVMPDEAYSCTVSILVYKNQTDLYGTTSSKGTRQASAQYTADNTIYKTWTTFYFLGTQFGGYRLSNS